MADAKSIELYIHIPFCVRKCAYCDFLSAPADEDTMARYVRQLIGEIRVQGSFYEDYVVTTVYIGGGTPTVLKSAWISSLMSAVYEAWAVRADAEVSIECNPGTVDQDKLMDLKVAGINRLSIGLQSTVESELKTLGRIHSYEDFLRCFEDARKAGYGNVNVDLISAVPGQTAASWKTSLERVIGVRPDHISAYSLIVEEGTPFHEIYGTKEGRQLLPSEEETLEMDRLTRELLAIAHYRRYEISNYAKPGYECRHNIGYWTGAEYLGLGLGASGCVKGRRFHVEEDLEKYFRIDYDSDITPLYQEVQRLGTWDRKLEFVILGLRMTDGVSAADYYDLFRADINEDFSYAISVNRRRKLLQQRDGILKLTEKGLQLANVVARDFYNTDAYTAGRSLS